MRFAAPITAALVALTALVAPITAQQTTTECETTMGDRSMTTTAMGDESITTTETMGDETTTCMGDEEMDDGMTDTTSEMADESMNDTTDAPEGSSAFAPGFGIAAAVVALLGALFVARRR